MSDNQQLSLEDEDKKKAEGRAFIKKLIIGKLILLIVMACVGYYLFISI